MLEASEMKHRPRYKLNNIDCTNRPGSWLFAHDMCRSLVSGRESYFTTFLSDTLVVPRDKRIKYMGLSRVKIK